MARSCPCNINGFCKTNTVRHSAETDDSPTVGPNINYENENDLPWRTDDYNNIFSTGVVITIVTKTKNVQTHIRLVKIIELKDRTYNHNHVMPRVRRRE